MTGISLVDAVLTAGLFAFLLVVFAIIVAICKTSGRISREEENDAGR